LKQGKNRKIGDQLCRDYKEFIPKGEQVFKQPGIDGAMEI